MSGTRDYHRPLVSGIRVASGREVMEVVRRVQYVEGGTLTGLATRNTDGKKVLVTNMHVMAGETDDGRFRNPSGDEEMYQPSTDLDYRVGTNLVHVPIVAGQNNVADVAYCVLADDDEENQVEALFRLHDSRHSARRFIAGVKEPATDMQLTLTAMSGETTATVLGTGVDRNIKGTDFTGIVRLRAARGLVEGDSGTPCFYRVRDGVYRLACIVFAMDLLNPQIVWAFPASVAERELGITFGNQPPVADAGPDQTVTAGDTVTLDASMSIDPDADPLTRRTTYRWEQMFGSEYGAIASRDGVTLSDNTVAMPTFPAPSHSTTLTFEVTVTDTYGDIDTDTVKITVNALAPAAPANLRATSGDRQVTLRWDNPNDASITRYEYQIQSGTEPWGFWTTIPGSGAATVSYVEGGLTNGTAYTIQVRAVNANGAGSSAEAGPVTPTAPRRPAAAPDPPTPWRDTGSTRGCGPDKEKEQRRTSSGRRQTRWVAAPEAETWGSWSRTGRTRGSNQSREAEESRTSNCGNTQTRWVAYPEPETWGSWSRTGNTRGSGIWSESEEARTSSYGNRQTRWVDDPVSETWGSWFRTAPRTGRPRSTAPQNPARRVRRRGARTSSYGNRQTRWVPVL